MYICRHPGCDFTRYKKIVRNRHEERVHNLVIPEEEVPNNDDDVAADDLFNYSKAHLSLGLLLMNADDAIKEGDGERLQRVLGVLTFVFKATGNTKYAYACLRLKACRLALLSPRSYHQLIHNRFINTSGERGRCFSKDLRLEHLNAILKPMIKSAGFSNICDKVATETSKALSSIEKIVKNTKADVEYTRKKTVHGNKHGVDMFQSVFKEVHDNAHNMTYTPGRKLVAYRGIKANIFDNLKAPELFKWIRGHRDRWHDDNYHFYNFE